ncbi:MAG TPA: hypothetical protein VE871_21105 [Longimicrobium sp.]|nr:hypothetical protein [Longimicrobium sp.]
MDALKTYLAPLQNATPEELIAYESRNDFESLRAYLDPMEDSQWEAMSGAGSEDPTGNEARALENDGITRDDFPVGDAFLSVLNNRGEIQVAGRVYKVTRDYVYDVAPADLALLNQKVPTLSSQPPLDDARITVRPVETTLARESEVLTAKAPSGGAVFHHVPGVGGNCYVYAGDKRMHGKSYISNFFFYGEAGVSTEWERRKKFLWWTTWSNTWQNGTLSHTYTGELSEGMWTGPFSPIGPGTASQSQTGTAKVHRTLTWVAGLGMRIRGTIHTKHNVSNSNVTGSCDTAASA